MGYDLGAPFLSGLHNLTRRGEHCSPKHPFNHSAGAQCAPLRENMYQSLDAVRQGEWPEGQEKVLRCVPALR